MNWLLFFDLFAAVFGGYFLLTFLVGIYLVSKGSNVTIKSWAFYAFLVTIIYGVTRYFS